VVVGVVSVVPRDDGGQLLTPAGVPEDDVPFQCEVDCLLPVAGSALQRPQRTCDGDPVVDAGSSEQVLVVPGHLAAAATSATTPIAASGLTDQSKPHSRHGSPYSAAPQLSTGPPCTLARLCAATVPLTMVNGHRLVAGCLHGYSGGSAIAFG